MRRFILPILAFIFVAATFLLITKPFFHDGFFPTMDDVQVVRVDEMTRELETGQFPVRLTNSLGNGGGYPLFNFYAPQVYYLGALYHIAGFTLVQATKLVFVTGYIVGALGIMVLLKKYSDWLTTTIGSLLFLTATYVNYDVFTRGALAEFFALMLLPWLFWSFLQLKDLSRVPSPSKLSFWGAKRRQNLPLTNSMSGIRRFWSSQNDKQKIIIAGSLFGLLVVTHNITSFIATIFLGLLLVIPPINRRILLYFGLAGLLGLGLSAFFWIPVVFEQHYTILSTIDFVTEQYKSNFLNPLQLGGILQIPWGFKPPLLGIGLFLGALLSLIGIVRQNQIFQSQRRFDLRKYLALLKTVELFSLAGFTLALFLIWSVSRPLWDYLPYMRFMQFPWRYLSLVTVFAVLAISLGLGQIKNKVLRMTAGIILILPAVLLQRSYLQPTNYNYIAHYRAEDSCRSTSWAQEQLPVWVKECLPQDNVLPLVTVAAGNIVVDQIKSYANDRSITARTSGFGGMISINKYYYPGWVIRLDNEKQVAGPATQFGIMQVIVPPGDHTIAVYFTETRLRSFANFISLVSVLLVVLCLLVLSLARLDPFLYNRKSTFDFASQ